MKFKIGDKVRAIREYQKGVTGTVANLRKSSDNMAYPYGIITDQTGYSGGSGERWTKGYENRNIIAATEGLELISTTKFKVGDKVKCVKGYEVVKIGNTGIIRCNYLETHASSSIPWGIEWDQDIGSGHDCDHHCKKNGYYVGDEHIELIEPNVRNVVIRIPTIEDFRRVIKQIQRDGIEVRTEWINVWSEYSEQGGFAVSINDNKYCGYCKLDWYKSNSPYCEYEFLTAQEYLNKFNQSSGEEPESQIAGYDIGYIPTTYPTYWYPAITKTSPKPKRKRIMSIIKNIFKTKEQKALSCYDLTNGGGGLTPEGRGEFVDFLWETDKETRKEFTKKVVEKYDEDNKKK